MDLTYAELSVVGSVRPVNEDSVGVFLPDTVREKRARGAVMIIADGVGGQGDGQRASRMAIETALACFHAAPPNTEPRRLVADMINAANVAVYDAGVDNRDKGRMATTLTISILRDNEVTIGHVGDCRVYLIHNGQLRCLTSDHSYAGVQLKMGLLSEQEAMTSELRCMLTRSVGQDIVVAPEFHTVRLRRNDLLVQCSDGLHGWVTAQEILNTATAYDPAESCRRLIELASKRATEDNISVQVVRVHQVEHVAYFKGSRYYIEPTAVPEPEEIRIGDKLDGRFQILAVLSRGPTTSVFKATDLQTGQLVAVKAANQQDVSPETEERFHREEQIGCVLDHPSILRVIPVERKSWPYLVVEYIDGETLYERMQSVKPLPVNEAISIASQICDALDYMHRRRHNVVHCDLKPQNIMLCKDGTLRVMDFGIAKATGSRSIDFKGIIAALGTPDYMAPEQVKGERPDETTDIYSLGAMLYEMTTGCVPFDGPNAYAVMQTRLRCDPLAPRLRNAAVPCELEEIILHAMERQRDKRYGSAAQMQHELEELDKVVVTGRCARLQAPVLRREIHHPLLRSALLIALPILVSLAILLLMGMVLHKT
ncbi:MAG TPA: protein kinase [Planctomycetota bacterium]|jgi:serine/threonine-protein kinase